MTPTPLQEIFKPTLQYLKAEQFDAARTNTNYISRVINIKKKIDSFIVQANDVIDDADTVRRKVFFFFVFGMRERHRFRLYLLILCLFASADMRVV